MSSHSSRNFQRWLYGQLDPADWPRGGLSPVNRIVIGLIVLSVIAAVLESEPEVSVGHDDLFQALELAFGVLFGVEYLARLWTAPLNPKYGSGIRGVLRYATTPAAVLDLLALSPAFIIAIGGEAYLLRLFRLVRVLRLARLGRFSHAIVSLTEAVRSRRYELLLSVFVALLLLLVTSTLLYLVEGGTQPRTFGSIPRAMWWSIVTLTTVGYGDVFPQTPLGKVLAGLTAVTGIGLIAMPTGILASAFSDAIQRERQARASDDSDAKREP